MVTMDAPDHVAHSIQRPCGPLRLCTGLSVVVLGGDVGHVLDTRIESREIGMVLLPLSASVPTATTRLNGRIW